ncbi:nuclear pore complex protein NUP98A-like, partial [Juglans microcarpa x Juglans regia]|uniref:nuclear pore complex protein NUP98A-like n=1 Tax=Juglans microcarpa x Juglans regia TaxID=2249226 RepID=UPI001B7EDCF0
MTSNPFAPKSPSIGGFNFGSSTTPTFSSSPFTASTSSGLFGSKSLPTSSNAPVFGAGGAFGASNNPLFGSSSTPMFGTSSTPTFGTLSTPVFGTSSTHAFGASSTPPFGVSSTPSFSFGSFPAFGQSAYAFGSTPFGTTTSHFGAQSSQFGAQSTTAFGSTGFGQAPFGTQHGGSRVAPYTPTTEDDCGTQATGKLESISAMPVYKDKSHDELRWEDYQLEDKNGLLPASQPTGGVGFSSTTTSSNILGPSATFGHSSPIQKVKTFGQSSASHFSASMTSNPASTSSGLFGSRSLPTSSNALVFGSGGAFGASSSPLFGSSSTPMFGTSSTSAFGTLSTPAFGTLSTPAFGASSTTSFSFGSSPAFGQSASAFGSTLFGTTTTPFAAQSSPFGAQSTTPTFGNSDFGQAPFGTQRGGSRVAPYMPTTEADSGTQATRKLESITAMYVYKDKNHKELRWEDYQLEDKDGLLPASLLASGIGFSSTTTSSNILGPSTTFGQSSASPFSASMTSNPFAPKSPSIGDLDFGSSTTPTFSSSTFSTSTSSGLFGSTSLPTSS